MNSTSKYLRTRMRELEKQLKDPLLDDEEYLSAWSLHCALSKELRELTRELNA